MIKIKYTVNYSKGFYIRLILIQYYRRWYVKILTLGGLVSFIFCFAFLLSWNPIGFHSFPFFGALYALLVAILPFYLIFKTNRTIQSNSLFNQEIEFEIDSTLIKISYPNFEKIILWSQIFKVENDSNAWLIYGTPHSFFYLPIDTLNTEQKDLFMKWVVESSKFSH